MQRGCGLGKPWMLVKVWDAARVRRLLLLLLLLPGALTVVRLDFFAADGHYTLHNISRRSDKESFK